MDAAFDHAEQVISFERSVGLFVEPAWQRAIIDNDTVVAAANAVYIAFLAGRRVHAGVVAAAPTGGVPRFRNAVLASGALSLVLFAVYPLAPRFVPEYGFVDTIAQHA